MVDQARSFPCTRTGSLGVKLLKMNHRVFQAREGIQPQKSPTGGGLQVASDQDIGGGRERGCNIHGF